MTITDHCKLVNVVRYPVRVLCALLPDATHYADDIRLDQFVGTRPAVTVRHAWFVAIDSGGVPNVVVLRSITPPHPATTSAHCTR